MSAELRGTWRLVGHTLRQDRVTASVWAIFVPALVLGTAKQYEQAFPTAGVRAEFAAEVRTNSALSAFTGQLHGDGLGNLALWKIGDIALMLVGLMAVLTVIRHTRAEEESGRVELLRIGRFALLTASLIETVGLSVVIGLLSAATSAGFGTPGALAFGASIAAVGCAYAAVAAVAAQLTERARTANAIASTVLGVGYVLRFVADGSGALWLRWLSPTGWAHLVQPYAGNRWWVLLVPIGFAIMTAATAYWLTAHRDFGAGVIPAKPGRVSGDTNLAWRIHRGQLIGWTAAFVVVGLAAASVAGGMRDMGNRSGTVAQEFFKRYAMTPHADIADTFVWMIILSFGYIAALYPMLAVLRMRTEETTGRAEFTLATGLSRMRWAAGHLAFAALGVAVMMLAGGLAVGLVHGQLPLVLGATAMLIPAVWIVGAIAMFAFGAAPKAAVACVWTVFVMLNVFGDVLGPVLGIDYWLANQIVPFHHLPKILTGAAFDATPLIVLTAATALIAAAGLVSLKRRDLPV
ncbi:ABC transporter permease [Kibdelosporangium philippinense]|uniref:ABC transporter permease n=1 Tax=Kibdelosporangium philippinense TaxID=211113 RepID=A0ABS8Z0S6_9PSEU|nr:ABC transporter permease [Kibdelosporangium philippinense]MCE7001460.1 ABC transporter permease [Kibdelosporangium philippinense]